jgi:large subunit ribosomal protein L4
MAELKAPFLHKQGKADLPEEIFSEPFHESLVHQAARADLNARRRGTHSSLTRGEVSMTTAKAWRQKGTGRARAGALSVPHRYGGGAAFGPKPRTYTFKVNRKARRRAMRAALSVHAERGSLAVLGDGAFDAPATKQAAQALAKWGADAPTLVLVGADEEAAAKSFRNIPRVQVAQASAAGVADVIGAASLVVSEPALEELTARAGSETRTGGGGEPKGGKPRAEKAKAEKPKAAGKPKAEKPKAKKEAAARGDEPAAEATSKTADAGAQAEAGKPAGEKTADAGEGGGES